MSRNSHTHAKKAREFISSALFSLIFRKKKKIRNWFLRGESALIYSMPKDVLWDGNSHQRKPINWGRVP